MLQAKKRKIGEALLRAERRPKPSIPSSTDTRP
jgi:hypothetical protein